MAARRPTCRSRRSCSSRRPRPVADRRSRRPVEAPPPVELTIDGQAVTVPAGSTILEACRAQGIDTPTLCYLENLTPVNVCRVCVVEVTGSRVLVPACSRRSSRGWRSRPTPSASATAGRWSSSSSARRSTSRRRRPPHGYVERYGADPARYGAGRAAAAAGERDAHEAGHHHAPAGEPQRPQTVDQPVKVDNDLYVRDYSKCILCYKCVEACGEDAQNTFAIAVAGRGFDARISTE